MRYNYAMTSPKDTSPEEEGADADGVDRDGAEQEEDAVKSVYGRLSSCNMTDTNVHLIQLHRECIQASIHVLQLRHDVS